MFLLRWECVDWRTRTIFIPFGKTKNARRRLPMTERVAQALLARMPMKPEGWVFPSARSKSGHLTTVAKAWHNAREKAGLPKSVVMYCARHTFGTVAATSGNLFAVKTAMGHASLQTTEKYQHPGLEQIRATMEQKNAETALRHNLRHSVPDRPLDMPAKLLKQKVGPLGFEPRTKGL